MTGQIPRTYRQRSELLPSSVALIKDRGDVETKPFYIAYENYNDKLCEIQNLNSSKSKRALKDFKSIGKLYKLADFSKNNIDYLPIKNSGEYKKLYRGLPTDIELKEHKIGKTERIFYYIVSKIFFVVAITNKHIETSKTRR